MVIKKWKSWSWQHKRFSNCACYQGWIKNNHLFLLEWLGRCPPLLLHSSMVTLCSPVLHLSVAFLPQLFFCPTLYPPAQGRLPLPKLPFFPSTSLLPLPIPPFTPLPSSINHWQCLFSYFFHTYTMGTSLHSSFWKRFMFNGTVSQTITTPWSMIYYSLQGILHSSFVTYISYQRAQLVW